MARNWASWASMPVSAVMAGWALLAPPSAAACRLVEVAEAPARLTGGGIALDAAVDGTPVTLRLDTGSAVTIIWRATADRLGLQRLPNGNRDAYPIEGGDRMRLTIIALGLGSLTADDLKLPVADDRGSADGSAGLLGEDLLSQYDLEIDLAHQVVRFFRPSTCPGSQMPYWVTARYSRASLGPQTRFHEGVFTTVRLNGSPVTAIFSTGVAATVVKSSIADSRQAQARPTVGSPASPWVRLFDTVAVGDETIHNARIAIADEPAYGRMNAFGSIAGPAAQGESGMIIGADFFRSHRALISPSRRAMYFTYNGGGVFEDQTVNAAPGTGGAAPP